MLIAALLLCVGQVKSEGRGQEVELICPDGWVAYQLNYYKYTYRSNCSTCLTCQRNSVLHHRFNIVELCVVFQPEYTAYRYHNLQPEICTENNCTELHYQPSCGMALTISNHIITSKKVLPCQTIHPEAQNDTLNSVDLICPRTSSFKSLFEKGIFHYYQGKKWTYVNSFCVLCDINITDNFYGKQITICSPHFYPKENIFYQFEYKILSECQDKDTSKCAPHTILPIQKGLDCGSKFTASRNGDQVNISNYIPCTYGKTDTKPVMVPKS